jgi:hypothetical protein
MTAWFLNALNWFYSAIASVYPQPFVGLSQYSAISGLVMDIEIGTPVQRIKVGLDFSSSVPIRVFPLTECPMFVGDCFIAHQSSTFDTQSKSDIVRFGSVVFDQVEITEIERFSQNQISAKYLEVAGLVGMGLNSPLMANRIFAVSESRFGVQIKELLDMDSYEIPDIERLVTVPLIGTDEWILNSHLVFGNNAVVDIQNAKIRFDPGVEDLYIPQGLQDEVLAALRVSGTVQVFNKRLVVKCNSEPIKISIFIPTIGITIAFSPNVFVPAELSRTEPMCLTRIYFKREISNIIIGRILTRSVGNVFLNYRDNSLSLIPDGPGKYSSFDSTKPLVPVFRAPLHADLSSGAEALFIDHVGSHREVGYFLVSQTIRRLTFVRAKGTLRKRKSLISDRVKAVHVSVSKNGIKFAIVPGGSGTIDVSEKGRLLVVSFSFSMNRFSVPKSVKWTPNGEVKECPICLEDYDETDHVQRLADEGDCSLHVFHKECIAAWLEKNSDCPVCRTPVSTRNP